MKKFFLFIAILLMFGSYCYAADLENWDIEASLDGNSAFFRIILEYDDYVTRSDYFMLTKLGDIKVFLR